LFKNNPDVFRHVTLFGRGCYHIPMSNGKIDRIRSVSPYGVVYTPNKLLMLAGCRDTVDDGILMSDQKTEESLDVGVAHG